jgi:hypothetical protein
LFPRTPDGYVFARCARRDRGDLAATTASIRQGRGVSLDRVHVIPAFTEILERRLPAKVVQYDPLTRVASGLALADYYGIGNRP